MPGAEQEAFALAAIGLAEPTCRPADDRHATVADRVDDLDADVQAVGELAAEHRHDASLTIDLDGMSARQLGPVAVADLVVADDERRERRSGRR